MHTKRNEMAYRKRDRKMSKLLEDILKEIDTPEYQEKMRKLQEKEKEDLNGRVGKTTEQDIDDLHFLLVNTVCSFCKERGLTDIESVSFSADGLMGSVPYGSWQACTDSSIKVEGLKYQNDEKFPSYYVIGKSI